MEILRALDAQMSLSIIEKELMREKCSYSRKAGCG